MTQVTISEQGRARLQAALDGFCPALPLASLTVVSSSKVLFNGRAGQFDPLDPTRPIAEDDSLWFASTAKLVTAVAYLQLVDRGVLTLDTPLGQFNPHLEAATSSVLLGYDDAGDALFTPADRPVTLRHMLNQTSGFGGEMGPQLVQWREHNSVGNGWVNSCKVENLIHKPIVEQPGTAYQYGNSAEWLSYMWPSLPLPPGCPADYEEYVQKHIFEPLGMTHSSFIPFDAERWQGKVAPTRLMDLDRGVYRELDAEVEWLTLPRSKAAIDYPSGGGGLYSTSADYAKLLQHLLRLRLLALDSAAPSDWPQDAILSRPSVESLFTPSLPSSALAAAVPSVATSLMTSDPGFTLPEPGEVDWTAGLGVYLPNDGRPWGGFGRKHGSVFWAGVSGIVFWIDPSTGIAAVFASQLLFSTKVPAFKEARGDIERLVYELVAPSP